MHVIFQRHHIPPDDFLRKSKGTQAFMIASMALELKAEGKLEDDGGDDNG